MLKRLLQRLFGKKAQSSYEIELTSSVEPIASARARVCTCHNDYPIPVEDIPDPGDQNAERTMWSALAHRAFIRWRTTSGVTPIINAS
jgi:hypothetical protein